MGKVKGFGKVEEVYEYQAAEIKTSPKVLFPKGKKKKKKETTQQQNPTLDEIFKLKTTKVV